jgi:hypothetical protein
MVTRKEKTMAKEKVKHMSAIFVSVFAHAGHISKEEAKEISGLDDAAFDKAYTKAAGIADKVMKAEGNKMDRFLKHFGEEIDEFSKSFASRLF